MSWDKKNSRGRLCRKLNQRGGLLVTGKNMTKNYNVYVPNEPALSGAIFCLFLVWLYSKLRCGQAKILPSINFHRPRPTATRSCLWLFMYH